MPRAKTEKSPNVPAFKRKRSLSAKARKRPALATALQRKEAGVPVVKPKRKRIRRTSSLSSSRTSSSSSGSGFSWGGASTSGTSSIGSSSLSSGASTESVYERRERLKAKLAERRAAGGMSSSSSGGGFASLSAAESRIADSGGFSAPMVDSSADVREMQECGVVDGFFDSVDVAAVQLTKSIRVGDKLIFESVTGLFEQELSSMQIDQEDVMTAYSGDDVGIKTFARPLKGGKVYKLIS
ncbi:hypothetical protein HOG17_01305 [Candidatus Peregrinibacteria bacterium]|jgi:hypothetical protein|nr:hypothetical protein [Candidatus Peregrinibacteria bacterium]MBT4148369.1 hypothetical protein [Candidatus Peregrinibacteria bacterium]MBT4365996.1 hypothetical protein [Candidatus Peregrinibacteria bacterium]MBT4456621.1 hypothetical protein [Candidatus Peregrinibacteria bacterium]